MRFKFLFGSISLLIGCGVIIGGALTFHEGIYAWGKENDSSRGALLLFYSFIFFLFGTCLSVYCLITEFWKASSNTKDLDREIAITKSRIEQAELFEKLKEVTNHKKG